MTKLVELNKEKYENYVSNHKTKSHFLQSFAWGELVKRKRNLTPYYVGLLNDKEEVIAAALLLEKKLPLQYSYFYAPRGFVLDYSDKDLIEDMTMKVIHFIKKRKAIFLKIDPDIIYRKHNYLEEEIPLDLDPNKVLNYLKGTGFKHLGFTKQFETNQPRYTFRIDLEQDLKTIEDHFSKTTKQRINKSKKIGTQVYIGDEKDIDEFYHLMTLTETRKDFVSYKKDYYQELYKLLKEEDMVTLFLGKVDFEHTIYTLNESLKGINNQISILPIDNLSKSAKNKFKELNKQKESILTDLEKYRKYKEKYGQDLILSAHMLVHYDDKAWVLYAGNHNELSETYVNYHTYYEHLKYAKEKGLKIYDQFGTIGDVRKDNPRLGLHEFKKKFGGDYIEFIGEFDFITNKIMYFVFTKLVPFYRNLVKRKAKKEVQDEVKRNQ